MSEKTKEKANSNMLKAAFWIFGVAIVLLLLASLGDGDKETTQSEPATHPELEKRVEKGEIKSYTCADQACRDITFEYGDMATDWTVKGQVEREGYARNIALTLGESTKTDFSIKGLKEGKEIVSCKGTGVSLPCEGTHSNKVIHK